MDLTLRTHKEHRAAAIDPANPVTFETTEEQYQLPNGGQVIEQVLQHHTDANGVKMDENSWLVKDGRVGEIIQAQNSFRCNRCFLFFNLRRRASRISTAEDPGVVLRNSGNNTSINIPVGYCGRCWWRVELWKCILLGLLRLLFDPIRAIHEAKQPEPCSSAPSPAPPPASPNTPTKNNKIGAGVISVVLFLAGTAITCGQPFIDQSGITLNAEANVNEVSPESVTPRQVEKLLEEVASLGLDQPSVDPVASGLVTVLKARLQAGVVDNLRYNLLVTRIEKRKEEIGEHMVAFKSPDPTKIYAPGDMKILRSVATNTYAGIPPALLRRGANVIGDTGTGKSSILRGLAGNWTAMGRPCLVFVSKPDQFFFKLARMAHNVGRSLLLRCHVDPIYNAFAMRSGRAVDFISGKMQKWQVCFNRWESGAVVGHILKLFDAEKYLTGMVAPTVDYVITKLEQIKLRRDLFNPSLKASVYETFSLMKESTLGRTTMRCQRGIDLEKIWEAGLLVVVDISRLRDDEAHFLLSCMLMDLREIREMNPGCLPDLLVVIDEAGSLIAQRWDSGNRLSPMASEVTLLRGSDIDLAVGFHTVAGVNPPVRANSAITIILPLGNGQDAFPAGQAAGLTPEQRVAIPKLKPYTAILKVTGTDWPEPLVVTWDAPQDYPEFTEAERQALNEKILATLPKILPVDYHSPAAVVTPTLKPAAVVPSPPTGDFLALLNDIFKRPYLNVSDRASGLNLPSKKVLTTNQLKAELDNLAKKGFCEFLTIQIKSRSGRGGEFYYLTANGHAAMGSLYKPARGSYGHDLAQRLIQQILADKGITATIEDVLPGTSKKVDLGLICPHSKLHVAIEVPLSTFSAEPNQAQEDLGVGWSRVMAICLNTTDLKKLRAEFRKAGVNDPRISAVIVADIRNAVSLSAVYDNSDYFV